MPLHLSESNLLLFSHSVVSDSETSLTAAYQASVSFTISWSLLKLMSIQPPDPLSLPFPALNLSQHQGLSNESAACIRWPKYWSFCISISPSSEYSVPGASTGDPTHDKVMRRDLMGKASQVSRGPLSEHLPRNQNLSVYCLLYYTLLT